MFCVILIIIIFLLVFYIYRKQSEGLFNNSKHLVGKVVIVTGASTGIGFETALDLAQRGARVILANRNENNGISARNEIVARSGNNDVHFQCLDLASFKSIRQFANNILRSEKRLDILINNAAVLFDEQNKTEDGLLVKMQINYFGPFLLTNLLLPLLIKTAPSRIINVSSIAYKYGYIDLEDLNMESTKRYFAKQITAYSNSKLCITLMTVELDRRLRGTGVTVNVLHPGSVYTNIFKADNLIKKTLIAVGRPFVKTPRIGAQTTIYLAVSPEVEHVSGGYFEDCKQVEMSKKAKDMEVAGKLWDISEKLVHLE